MDYDLGKDPLAARELREFYMREFKALQDLRTTGLVPEVKDPFLWSDDFLILPMLPPQGKPLSIYLLPETREEFVDELLLAAACFKGLDQIHTNKVLHRALAPHTIYVLQGGQTPKIVFTNFFAARVQANSIAVSLDALTIEDPYAHTDLTVGYGFATAETDIFSLALVFLERLSSVSIANLRPTADGIVSLPNLQQRWCSLPEDITTKLSNLFRKLVSSEPGLARLTAKQASQVLIELARRLRTAANPKTSQLLDNRYKVLRILGQGNAARTYLASDNDFEGIGQFALKQYRQPAEVLNQATAEFQALTSVASKHLPRLFDIYPPQNEVHVKMEYIPGPTLQSVESEFPWPVERWWPFAQGLLSAVEVLETHGLLHRDIKPANIILHDADGHPVLIDFGFAIQQGIVDRAAGTPLYWPPEAFAASHPPVTCDRYAVAVTLFKALTGYLPFKTITSQQRTVWLPPQVTDRKVRRVATVLLRALSNDPAERQATVADMRNELQASLLAIEEPNELSTLLEQVNPWLVDLPVWLIDLKRRAFVNLPDTGGDSIFRRALEPLVDTKRWQICENCSAKTMCPIQNNAVALRKGRVVQRLEYLFLLVHLRRQRHITMRDLRSALAYLITGNKNCQQIHVARCGEEPGASLIDLTYWRSTFAPLETNDELLMDIALLDPARFPRPYLDRFFHFHQSPRDIEQRQLLFVDKTDISPLRFKNERDWMAAIKRRLYFEAGKDARWRSLLPYQHATTFLKLLDERIDPTEVRERLARGILRSEGISGEHIPAGKVSVKVNASEEQRLIVLKQIPLEEFEIRVKRSQELDLIETIPEVIVLEHRSGTPRLEISIDLFELLMRMADGLQPNAPEYQPLLNDLSLFKHNLLLQEAFDLVLIENQHRVHYITQRDGKIVRTIPGMDGKVKA